MFGGTRQAQRGGSTITYIALLRKPVSVSADGPSHHASITARPHSSHSVQPSSALDQNAQVHCHSGLHLTGPASASKQALRHSTQRKSREASSLTGLATDMRHRVISRRGRVPTATLCAKGEPRRPRGSSVLPCFGKTLGSFWEVIVGEPRGRRHGMLDRAVMVVDGEM